MKPGVVSSECYQALLQEKADRLRQQFSLLSMPGLEVYESAPQYYRMRTEFRIWHESYKLHYAMFNPKDRQRPYFLTEFPVASKRINQLMPALTSALEDNDILSRRLFQVEFLTTQKDEALITLIYHRRLEADWEQAAKMLESQLNIHIIGRSRKQKLVLSQDYVTESLCVEGKQWLYRQYENSFTQPNAGVNEKMLAWVAGVTRKNQESGTGDLLELYCGNGNFTCLLAPVFNKVLATEISKASVLAAQHNLVLNSITNVDIARMSSEEFTLALNHDRNFRRLAHIDLNSYQFSTVFVDPPRAGLDPATLALVQRFDRIIYISCNPDTLQENIHFLAQSHNVKRFALFDQFPYTHHVESGVYLVRK